MKKRIPLHKLYSVIAAILIMVSITGCSERMPVFTYLSGETEASQSTSEQGSSPSSDPSQSANSSLASEYSRALRQTNHPVRLQRTAPVIQDSAQYGLLYDIPRRQNHLECEGADSRVYPASLTKLLTAYTALKLRPPSDTVFYGRHRTESCSAKFQPLSDK